MAKIKPTPAAKNLPEARRILYPELTVCGVPIPVEKMRISYDQMVKVLGWETEAEYKARCETLTDVHERAKGVAGFGDEYLLLDVAGNKVRCWNNLDNRPFDINTAEKYCQDILSRDWAGPSTMPGETVNGETMIVGRTGKVESGQHRGVALILAAQRWRKNPKNYPQWTEEPFLESLIVFGASESPSVVRTLDNVRARTLADTIYTSDVFKRTGNRETSMRERKELSRMLDAGIDLLWRRTGAGGANEPGRALQTHSTSFDFLARHERLKRCVKHLFETNADRKISLLQLSAGQCAAAMYLMACGTSDVDKYLTKREEKALDWSLWDKAEEFFTLLADGADFEVVRHALGQLKSLEGLGGRLIEKLEVLALAWHKFANDEAIEPDDLVIHYARNKQDEIVGIAEPSVFGNIDQGQEPEPAEKPPTPAEIEDAKKKERSQAAKDAIDVVKGKGKKGQGGGTAEYVAQLKEKHGKQDRLLIFASDDGDYNTYLEDAKTVATNVGSEPKQGPGGVPMYSFTQTYYETIVKQLMEAGHKLSVVRITDGEAEVVDVQPRGSSVKEPTPAAKPQPAAKVKPEEAKSNGTAKPKPTPKKKPTPVLRPGNANA